MAYFLAIGEACKAMFRPTPGLKEKTFDSFVFSAEGTLVSASAVLRGEGGDEFAYGSTVDKELPLDYSWDFVTENVLQLQL